MRLLRVTTTEGTFDVDLDDKTAIGINLQTYDIKEPGKRKINVSNSFTVPATANNMKIFGYAGNSQFTSTAVYSNATCDYWIDNIHLIKNSRIRFEEYEERISLFIFEKANIWDELKLLNWQDFTFEFLIWMQTYKGLPSSGSPYTGSFSDLMDIYINATEGLILSFYIGNFYDTALESTSTIQLNYANPIDIGEKGKGGHFCAFAKTIFEFIEYKYSVDFLTSGGEIIKNIWDDTYALSVFTPVREITITKDYPTNYFRFVKPDVPFLPLEDVQDKSGKSLYDFVNSFFQHFNIIIDEIEIDNNFVIALSRFDDIITSGEITNWSGISTDKPKFKPYIDKFAQINLIKFKEIYPEGDELIGSREIPCLNENLDAKNDLFEIDAYIPNFIEITNGVIPDLSIKESFKTFQFFVADSLTTYNVTINTSNYSGITHVYDSTSKQIKKAALYGLSGEYYGLESILEYPVYYEVKKWLTLYDIIDLKFFKKYYIRELNGCFFLNKISGFNPEKSNEPTTIELIKVSDETTYTPYVDFWVDGIGAIWTDGLGNYYY